jgi:RNA polymerase sigma-70 factor (ECF subfamily)
MRKNAEEYSDLELIRLLSGKRKESAFAMNEIYRRYSSVVYNFCYKFLQNKVFLDDIFQNVFIKLFEKAQGKFDISNLEAYLMKTTRNMCYNENIKKINESVEFDENYYNDGNDESEKLDKKNMLEKLDMALKQLPDEYREVIIMKDFLDFKYVQISEILDESLSVVRTRIYRAKQKLRDILRLYDDEIKDYNI